MNKGVSIRIDKNSEEPMYVQLYKAIKIMIEKEELADNERLPSIREVSGQLNINNSTVVNAYKLLESNGYAYSRSGSGTYACSKKVKVRKGSLVIPESDSHLPKEIKVKSSSINFASSTPDPELFPVDNFKNIINRVLERDGGEAFNYTEIRGFGPLRESVCHYMANNGVKCSPDSIQIISGAQQGIDIIAKVLIDYGDIIITEKPTYTGAIAVFKSRDAQIISVPVGIEGMDIEGLEAQLKTAVPKFIYIMTNFQNPTGYSYSHDTKQKLLYLADKYDFYIIEDDCLSDLYYNDKKPLPLKAEDYNDRVIFIKSFSKVFMPGIRLGFIIVPESMKERVAAAKHLTDISTSGFMQRMFDLYIRENMLDNHICSIREKYYERYKLTVDVMGSKLKGIDYYKPDGGVHLWVRLPEGISSNMLYSECLMRNVIVSPGSAFYTDDTDSQYFRLSFISTGTRDIIKGIDILDGIISSRLGTDTDFKNILFL